MDDDFFKSKKLDKELLDLLIMNFVEDEEVKRLLSQRIFASSTIRQIESFYKQASDKGIEKLFKETCYWRHYMEIVLRLEEALNWAKELEASISKDLNGKYDPVKIFTDVYVDGELYEKASEV